MTTNKARRHTLALLLPLLLFAMGCDSQSGMADPEPTAVSAEAFMIRSERGAVSPATSEGTFKVFGAIDDQGAYTKVLASAEPLHKLTSLYRKKITVIRDLRFAKAWLMRECGGDLGLLR